MNDKKRVNRATLAALYVATYLGVAIIMMLFDDGVGKLNVLALAIAFVPVGLSMLLGVGDDLALLGYLALGALAIWGVISRRPLAYLLFLVTLSACVGGCLCRTLG